MKLYTWQDMCDYEQLLLKKWQLGNELRMLQGDTEYAKLERKMVGAQISSLNKLVDDFGFEISDELWEEIKNG